jgi:acetyl esterase/lipase
VICLLHGGFWRQRYARDQMNAVAEDLVRRGWAVWNLEYRRLGGGGGWPQTADDVVAGIDRLATVPGIGQPVIAVGHSAGGHLALWAAGQRTARVRLAGAVGLAPVADLVRAHELGLSGNVVAQLLGGSPAEHPERYVMASPLARLPTGVRQLVVHGSADDVVPIEIGRRYVEAARAAGDDAALAELPGCGHMEFLDPASAAHATLCRWLAGPEWSNTG